MYNGANTKVVTYMALGVGHAVLAALLGKCLVNLRTKVGFCKFQSLRLHINSKNPPGTEGFCYCHGPGICRSASIPDLKTGRIWYPQKSHRASPEDGYIGIVWHLCNTMDSHHCNRKWLNLVARSVTYS